MTAPVMLLELSPGTSFRLAGDRPGRPSDAKRFTVIAHTPTSTLVRETREGEQIEFTRSDGTPVDFYAHRRRSERWSGSTKVIPLGGGS